MGTVGGESVMGTSGDWRKAVDLLAEGIGGVGLAGLLGGGEGVGEGLPRAVQSTGRPQGPRQFHPGREVPGVPFDAGPERFEGLVEPVGLGQLHAEAIVQEHVVGVLMQQRANLVDTIGHGSVPAAN